jgi:hypothetical protein
MKLEDATENSIQASSNRSASAMQNADNEIARVRRILAEIDKLEADFDRVKHIRDVVKQIKARVDDMSSRIDRSHPSGHGQSHTSHSHSGYGSGRHAPRPHGR